jgi:hypothetical protein
MPRKKQSMFYIMTRKLQPRKKETSPLLHQNIKALKLQVKLLLSYMLRELKPFQWLRLSQKQFQLQGDCNGICGAIKIELETVHKVEKVHKVDMEQSSHFGLNDNVLRSLSLSIVLNDGELCAHFC